MSRAKLLDSHTLHIPGPNGKSPPLDLDNNRYASYQVRGCGTNLPQLNPIGPMHYGYTMLWSVMGN